MTPMIVIAENKPLNACDRHDIELSDGRRLWYYNHHCPYCALDTANKLIEKMRRVL